MQLIEILTDAFTRKLPQCICQQWMGYKVFDLRHWGAASQLLCTVKCYTEV